MSEVTRTASDPWFAPKPKGRHPHKRLSAAFLRSAPRGRYCDGNGLYLYVQKTGTRSWIQRLVIRGRKRDLGLGSVQLSGRRGRARPSPRGDGSACSPSPSMRLATKRSRSLPATARPPPSRAARGSVIRASRPAWLDPLLDGQASLPGVIHRGWRGTPPLRTLEDPRSSGLRGRGRRPPSPRGGPSRSGSRPNDHGCRPL